MSEPRGSMHETEVAVCRALKAAICAYLASEPMTDNQIAAIRAYLKRWIDSPYWSAGLPSSDLLAVLRAWIDDLSTRESIRLWLETASKIGTDPL